MLWGADQYFIWYRFGWQVNLASEKNLVGITTTPQNSNRITFKDAPLFLSTLESLIAKGYGIPTIQNELRSKGYKVPYATLGRWVKKRRVSH